jgi:glyceraldehyde-3-phosphate dehydrogenase (NADP+)
MYLTPPGSPVASTSWSQSGLPWPEAPYIDQRSYLLNGEIHQWAGACQAVESPMRRPAPSGTDAPVPLGSLPSMDATASLAALAAAVAAWNHGRGEWPCLTVSERIACVERLALLMTQKRAQVVDLIMWEIAKPQADCAKEFDRTLGYMRKTIAALKVMTDDNARVLAIEGTMGRMRRAPLGVVLCMGPYNCPLNETFTTLIPALLMGNTVVLKPPRIGALCYEPLLAALRDAFPAGVVNTVYGDGQTVIPPLMKSGEIAVLALIGSSSVADQLKKMPPKSNRLRAVLGLDAKNPAVVLADADMALAVRECLAGALSFNGQRCTALKILFVHRSVAHAFTARFVAAVNQLKIGMPWEEGVQITPLADPERLAWLKARLDEAQVRGAGIVNEGGGRSEGLLMTPAVLYPVSTAMRICMEEQFGPVVPIVPFDDIATVIDCVVASPFGQQLSLFGREAATLGLLARVFTGQVSRVNINAQCKRSPDEFPFTGRKDSAEGTLSVVDALRAFSIRSMVATPESEAGKALLASMLNDI